jgi:hypothetical protein
MLRAGIAALLLLAGGGGPPTRAPSPPPTTTYGRIVIRQQIVVRIPGRPGPDSQSVDWKEHKGPKCVPARAIAGAALLGQNSVDFILRDRTRVRAKLESRCPALDYYYGFYITPNPDGLVCADRDSIRSRVGGQCGIDRFRRLEMRQSD